MSSTPDPFGFQRAINWDVVDEHADEIAAIFEDDEDPRDSNVVFEDDEGVKWFLNECAIAYPYPADLQAEHFPNDFHTAYNSEEEAEEAAEALEDEDDSLLDSEMKALGWPPYDTE